jgi:indolepyruvate ferredoxin oxidoreductase
LEITLDDKWTTTTGRVVINGTQAISRVLLLQKQLDRAAGWNTAGYISGYRGSPLGNVDTTLWSIGERLREADVVFQPGLNEDIAATALRGTQQIDLVGGARYDGVFAAWYAKGPGVDRAGDAFKHGNFAGTHPKGGVVLFYGDDHAGKSSTVAHASEAALAASLIPSLYPADVGEVLRFGLMAFALSRYSGLWVGVKCVNEVAEQTATVDLRFDGFAPVLPARPDGAASEVNIRSDSTYNPLGDERTVVEERLPLVHAFVRANGLDRTQFRSPAGGLGIVAAGKSCNDVRAALALLDLSEEAAALGGISLYKPGCIWPLEPTGLSAFADGHQVLLIVEEKRTFIEMQAAQILVNRPDRPLLIGKQDAQGQPLLSAVDPFDPVILAEVIAGQLERLGRLPPEAASALALLRQASGDGMNQAVAPRRAPYFCSGCPHNRSTRVPEGSLSMTGIGCHTMVNFMRPDVALLPTQMGGEGGNWLGLAPFVDTPHIFQNMGDGTFYHSGLLAIRAAVAAKVNITYKLLYNDAVAMTGGQPVDGPISVTEMARQVLAEGVREVVLLSDDPAKHEGSALPSEVRIGHRDTLEEVQLRLREMPGCTIIIYEQTCAAEKRRRRKRGTFPDPDKRLFIATSVCENCGDCSVQSTCVSLVPVETEFGIKRAIDQSSCNKDYSCVDGFCPSFVTIEGAAPRKPVAMNVDEALIASLPVPRPLLVGEGFNAIIAGIGGTGVVTVGALLGMAAHIDGLAMSSFDMTGLSQKNGAVFSHLRIAARPDDITTQRIAAGEADVMLAFDAVAAVSPEALATVRQGRTRVLVNADVAATVAFQFDRDFAVDPAALIARLRRAAGADAVETVAATSIATALLGDGIGANLFAVGYLVQRGMLPMSVAAIEQAIALNGVAVGFNRRAFTLGRLYAAEPERLLGELAPKPRGEAAMTLEALIAHRAGHLAAYQDAQLAEGYRGFVRQVEDAERALDPASEIVTRAVAKTYARLLAYKDEYEVARLLSAPSLREEIASAFAPGARLSFNLAPPILGGKGRGGRPAKRSFGRWILPLLGVLARLKGLRGTWADPFGRTRERRTERALIAEYEVLVARILPALTKSNLAEAARLLAMAGAIRGFGPVKEAAAERYRKDIVAAEQAFLAPPPSRNTAAAPLKMAG